MRIETFENYARLSRYGRKRRIHIFDISRPRGIRDRRRTLIEAVDAKATRAAKPRASYERSHNLFLVVV